jgi:hypothetical protein
MRRLRFCFGAMTMLLLWAGPVTAATITLTFEGLKDREPVNNFYNGGTGGLGSGPGPNYGVTFTPVDAKGNTDAEALISKSAGGTGNFANNPSGSTIAFFLNGVTDTLNVASGFTKGFSFYYSAEGTTPTDGKSPAGTVDVFTGPNGTGTKLKTINLVDTGNSTPSAFDNWVPVGVTFAGTAESVVFNSLGQQHVGLDDITFGSQSPSVPEPASIVLLGLGGAGMLGYRWRGKRT